MKTPAGQARPIIEFLIDEAIRAGFTLSSVEDGFDSESETTEVSTKEEAMEAVFDTGEAVLFFGGDWIALIPENGEDVVHDWTEGTFGEVIREALSKMEHLECYDCGTVFRQEDASTVVETIEKRKGWAGITRSEMACPSCGGTHLWAAIRPPKE